MPTDNQEQLRKLANIFKTDNIITSKEIEQVLVGIMKIMVSFKKDNESLTGETKQKVSELLSEVKKENGLLLSSVSEKTKEIISDIEAKLEQAKSMVPKDGKPGDPGRDGLDADEEKIVADVLAKIELPTYKETILDGRKEIVDKINTGTDKDVKILATQVEGFSLGKQSYNLDRAISILDQRTQFLINKQSGAVNSVTAGSGITVDNTDPKNPIVSASGGGSGTVTSVSVVTANGLSGSVANPTTTPAITLNISALDATKIADGSVSNTEFQYLDGVTSAIQTQIGSKQATLVSGTSIKTINGASILASGDLTLLTSLSGAVLVDQTSGQTIGTTGARLTKLWATDITVTNALVGSITGNAATVTTNANLTGVITSSGNATSIASQTGTGTKFVVDTSPTLITPVLGVATATSINGLIITATAGTLTIPNNASAALITSGNFSITLTATATTAVTLPTSGTLVSSVTTGNGVSATNTAGALAFTLGAITPTTVNGLTITANGTNTLSITAGKTVTFLKTMSLTSADDTGVYTLPTGTKTLLATDGAGTSLTGIPYTLTGTANQVILSAGTGNITFSLPQSIGTGSSPQFSTIELGAASDTTLSRSAAGVLAVEGVVIPSISSTNTLTNKFITPQVQSVADAGGTLTPVSITNDLVVATALSQATTIAAPTGSPVQGERLTIRLKDNGTARALTWNSIYRNGTTITMPTTTITSKTLYVGFIYNSTDTKWDAVSYSDGF